MSRRPRRQDICDLYGRPLFVRNFRSGQGFDFTVAHLDWATDPPDSEDDTDDDPFARLISRRVSQQLFDDLLERSRSRLTTKQFAVAKEVVVEGRSLHAFARECGVSVEALRQRISSTVSRTVVWMELSAPPAPMAIATAAIDT